MSNEEKPKPCEFCKKEKCECKRISCPIHGNTKALLTPETVVPKDDKTDKTPLKVYKCSAEDCKIKRHEKEL